MKAVIISTSLRAGSFSHTLAEDFARGVRDSGNEAEVISLKGKKIGYCIGCEKCQEHGRCVLKDDAPEITDIIRTADAVVWAAPVYYYSMPGQMKVLIDRSNSLYTSELSFRDVYLLATCAEPREGAVEGTLKGVEGWVGCLNGTRIAGCLCAYGMDTGSKKEVDAEFRQKAYDMGKNAFRS